MKKIIKIAFYIFLVLMVMYSFFNISFAAYNYQNELDWADGEHNSDADNSVQNVVGSIIVIVRIIAVGVAVIMLVVLAMKYMMSAPNDRAEIKKHAVVYVVGAIVLFASGGILSIIQKFASSI